jgi:hypothetical protein
LDPAIEVIIDATGRLITLVDSGTNLMIVGTSNIAGGINPGDASVLLSIDDNMSQRI